MIGFIELHMRNGDTVWINVELISGIWERHYKEPAPLGTPFEGSYTQVSTPCLVAEVRETTQEIFEKISLLV